MQRTPSHQKQTTSTQKVTGGQVTSQTGRQGGTRVEDKVDLDIQRDQDLQEVVAHQTVVDEVNPSKECLL